MTGSARMVVRRCAGPDVPGGVAECGCCGSRFPPRRVRMWLAVGVLLHGEVCPECILRGPRGAAGKIRERIRAREARRAGRRKEGASGGWSGWMAGRARILEAMECFPLSARQAAVREMREKR